MSSRPNADELMGFALEASEYMGAIPRNTWPPRGGPVSCAESADVILKTARFELSKGDSKAARPWLLRALYLIGGALSEGKATTPEEPRDERRYTRAEVDELLGRTKTNLETLGAIYHATRNESDANLRRAIAAEMEVQGLRGQMERLAKKGGA